MEEPMERLLEAGDPDRIVQKAVGGMFTAA
jgi:hypothetical protein